MNWATKRKLVYFLIFFAVVLGFLFLIISPYLHVTPMCTDGRKNGKETGVDCGGTCPRACTQDLDKIDVLWSRTFRVVPGRYNAVAYLENHNKTAAVYKVKYRFRFADSNNIYIGKRDGETFIPASGRFSIFEPAVDVGNSIPVYTSFEFTEEPVWYQVSPNLIEQLKINAVDIRLENEDTAPALFATVKNTSLIRIPSVYFIALLYDEFGNVVSASNTYVDYLGPRDTKNISFTWQEKFDRKIVSKEIIPMYNIFLIKP